jgi:hypothetical protein
LFFRQPESVGINLQRIVSDHKVTWKMFDEPGRADLESVVDRLNRRYGCTTLTRGVALEAAQYLRHERIPFGKPMDAVRLAGGSPTRNRGQGSQKA